MKLSSILPQTREELHNTITHLIGAISAASLMWILIRLAQPKGWQWTTGVSFLCVGTLLMYAFSTSYHWTHQGRTKRVMRILDHIGIYIMIASSYTPIYIGLIGGLMGWTMFAFLWAIVLIGAYFKITALGRYPRLSLLGYLAMGWSVVFVAKPVFEHFNTGAALMILAEGIFYTVGSWFFAHDSKPFYHAIWHIFVLLGTISHWIAIIMLMA